MSKQLNKVDFDLIRYANCWEDPKILLEALAIDSQSKALSIASAGDNSFALLTGNPELVVAVDVNEIQLLLCELKMVAIRILPRADFLVLLGFELGDRWKLYNQIKNELSTECRGWIEQNKAMFERGVINEGKFEKYFQLFSGKVLPWIHGKKTIQALFESKNAGGQQQFYDSKWNSLRWRLLFKVFFSKYVMGKYGRDPEFLREVEVNVGQFIFDKAAQELSSEKAQKNFMLHYIMKGRYSELPLYATEGRYEEVQSNIGAMQLYKGLAEDAFKKYGTFNRFNLSNIFEYMNPEIFNAVGNQILEGSDNDARIAYWNLMVPRNLMNVSENMNYDRSLSDKLTAKDDGFFYRQFLVNHVRK